VHSAGYHEQLPSASTSLRNGTNSSQLEIRTARPEPFCYDVWRRPQQQIEGLMSELADFIRWCNRERTTLRRSLEMMESGIVHTSEVRPGLPPKDTTAESIARAKKNIVELDALLAKHAS